MYGFALSDSREQPIGERDIVNLGTCNNILEVFLGGISQMTTPNKKQTNSWFYITAIANSHKQFTVCKTVNPQKLLTQRISTVQQDHTVPGNCRSTGLLRQQKSSLWRIQKSPENYSPQDYESPAITSSEIKYCPAGLPIPGNYLLKEHVQYYPARAKTLQQ